MSKRFELWDGEDSSCLFPVGNEELKQAVIEEGQHFVQIIEAENWKEAKSLMDAILAKRNPERNSNAP